MNLDYLDHDDVTSIRDFYKYTKEPHVTAGDCWQYLEELVSTDACLDGLNLVDGSTYTHFLPAKVLDRLNAKDHSYVARTGLFNFQKAQRACKTLSSFPRALSLNGIRRDAHKAVKELAKVSVKD